MAKRVGLVCIVDDDKVYRFTTEKYIKMLNLSAKVTSFSDGEEALTYIKENLHKEESLPDILLLDVNMPIMDGWDFLEEYEQISDQITKDIKIYMVSSSVDERDQRRSKEYAAVTDYLVKPITEEDLAQLIS